MSIIRRRLYRGSKVAKDRINEVHSAVSTAISSGIEADAQPGTGRFSIVWNLPSIQAYQFDGLAGNPDSYSKILIPWMLPPPMDYLSSTGQVGDNTPFATMRRLSVGIDQAETGYEFTGPDDASGAGVDYKAGGYAFTLELREKVPAVIGKSGLSGSAALNVPDRVVWSQAFPDVLFSGDRVRFNPLVIEDLRVTIHPYRTYVWYIRFTGLVSAETEIATLAQLGVSSFTLRAEFEYPLLNRDTYSGLSVQNIPTVHDGARQAAIISLDTATANNDITAEVGTAVNGRVQRNLDTIDDRLTVGLDAGYDNRGRLPVEEELVDDAGYFCIAVPMFGQFGDIRASDINTVGLPYGPQGDFSAGVWAGSLADRRVIRLQHPVTIHHVVAVPSYYSPPTATLGRRFGAGSGKIPVSATNITKIGVGMVSGLVAEDRQYQQIAYLEVTPATKSNYVLDRIKEGGPPFFFGLATDGAYDHEIFHVPLVWPAALGTGLYGKSSGAPVYAGQSDLTTLSRRNIGVMPFDFGGGALSAANTAGQEQFLEVRWTIEDANSLSQVNGSVDPGTTYVGNGGCWVYIIGKKSAV
jgi:hypothetical protein